MIDEQLKQSWWQRFDEGWAPSALAPAEAHVLFREWLSGRGAVTVDMPNDEDLAVAVILSQESRNAAVKGLGHAIDEWREQLLRREVEAELATHEAKVASMMIGRLKSLLSALEALDRPLDTGDDIDY